MVNYIKLMIEKNKGDDNTLTIRKHVMSVFKVGKSAANDAIRVARKQLGLYRKNSGKHFTAKVKKVVIWES